VKAAVYVDVLVTPDGGACPASPQQWTKEPPTWANSYIACPSPDTCPNGVCVPNPTPSPYKICIYQASSATLNCPSPYTFLTTVEGVQDDTRACTDCSCTPLAVTCGQGTATFSFDSTCGGNPIAIPSSACTQIPPVDAGTSSTVPLAVVNQPPAAIVTGGGTSCTKGGGAQTGGVTTNLTTICCM
jgi:hypothetical protein